MEVRDGRLYMREAWTEPQRTIDEYILRPDIGNGFRIPHGKAPNYRKGLRWRGRCQLAYPSQTCPTCGTKLRTRPRQKK